MVRLRVRKIEYEDREFEREEIVTLTEAAEVLGMTVDAVISAIRTGRFTEVLDPDAIHKFKNRRFMLRSEVEEAAELRAKAAARWAPE